MSTPRKSDLPTGKTTTTPEAMVKDNLPAFLNAILDDFNGAYALVTVANRHIDEWDDEDRGAAVLVLGKGVQALGDVSDKLEKAWKSYARLRGPGVVS
jgi:hypothetical protein